MSVTQREFGPVITVGQLRQNPTAMIRAVRAGAKYTLTDHWVPVAMIAPIRGARWVTFDQIRDVMNEPAAQDWWHAIEQAREDAGLADPWEQQ